MEKIDLMFTVTSYTLAQIFPEPLMTALRNHASVRWLVDLDKQINQFTVSELTEMALTVMGHTEPRIISDVPLSVFCLNKIFQLAREKYDKDEKEYAQRHKIP